MNIVAGHASSDFEEHEQYHRDNEEDSGIIPLYRELPPPHTMWVLLMRIDNSSSANIKTSLGAWNRTVATTRIQKHIERHWPSSFTKWRLNDDEPWPFTRLESDLKHHRCANPGWQLETVKMAIVNQLVVTWTLSIWTSDEWIIQTWNGPFRFESTDKALMDGDETSSANRERGSACL